MFTSIGSSSCFALAISGLIVPFENFDLVRPVFKDVLHLNSASSAARILDKSSRTLILCDSCEVLNLSWTLPVMLTTQIGAVRESSLIFED